MGGDLTQHFSRREVVCHHCKAGVVSPQLLQILELLRQAVGKPLIVVSGFRCEPHNRAVGGANDSRHTDGDAADLKPGYATTQQARDAGAIGIGSSGPWAVHVDWRPGRRVEWKYS